MKNTMRLLTLLVIVLALTGCDSEKHKTKVYRKLIELYKPEKLKVLYSEPKESLLEKYYKVHLIETDIAKIELNTEKLRRMNADTKKWIMLALQEINEARTELARRKTEIAKIHKQSQLLMKMRRELDEINIRIEKIKKKRHEERERLRKKQQEERERRLRS